jgi:hypothetical protein
VVPVPVGYRIEINPLAAATATRRSYGRVRRASRGQTWRRRSNRGREEAGDQRAVVGGGPPDAVRRGLATREIRRRTGLHGRRSGGRCARSVRRATRAAAGVEARTPQGRGPPATRRRSSGRKPADPRALGGARLRRRHDDRRRRRAQCAPTISARTPTIGRSTARGSCCSSTSGS